MCLRGNLMPGFKYYYERHNARGVEHTDTSALSLSHAHNYSPNRTPYNVVMVIDIGPVVMNRPRPPPPPTTSTSRPSRFVPQATSPDARTSTAREIEETRLVIGLDFGTTFTGKRIEFSQQIIATTDAYSRRCVCDPYWDKM